MASFKKKVWIVDPVPNTNFVEGGRSKTQVASLRDYKAPNLSA